MHSVQLLAIHASSFAHRLPAPGSCAAAFLLSSSPSQQVGQLQAELAAARDSLREAQEAARLAEGEGQRLREQAEELQGQSRALSEMQQQAQKYNAQLQEYNSTMQGELQVGRQQAGQARGNSSWRQQQAGLGGAMAAAAAAGGLAAGWAGQGKQQLLAAAAAAPILGRQQAGQGSGTWRRGKEIACGCLHLPASLLCCCWAGLTPLPNAPVSLCAGGQRGAGQGAG